MDWLIEPVSSRHDRKQFRCEEQALTNWLARHALQNHLNGISKTQVAVRPGDSRVYGYYCLSNYTVQTSNIPDDVREDVPGSMTSTPCTLLGRLARDVEMKGQGLGPILLTHALQTALHASDLSASYAIVVHAKHEKAKNFYLKYDFVALMDNPLHLLLHMRKVRELVSAGNTSGTNL